MSQARTHDYGGPVSDHLRGVVFYQLNLKQVAVDEVRTAVAEIAEFMGAQSRGRPFVVRVALRNNHDGTYWVGLNSTTAGELFQQLLIELQAKVFRAYRLPGPDPNPPLAAVLGEPLGYREPLPQPRDRRGHVQEPADHHATTMRHADRRQGLDLTDQAKAARAELGSFDFATALGKLKGLRKGGWRGIGKRRRDGGDDGE